MELDILVEEGMKSIEKGQKFLELGKAFIELGEINIKSGKTLILPSDYTNKKILNERINNIFVGNEEERIIKLKIKKLKSEVE